MTVKLNKGPFLGMRHLQVALLFVNIVVVYIGRYNISVTLVAMTNAETTNPDFPEYDWNEKHKALIISSFFWGYVMTQFAGGWLCRRFGVKLILTMSTFGTAVSNLVTPFCIPWGGWKIYCALRLLQGLLQGPMFPCIHQHLAKWSPLEERNRLGALAHTGIECGNVMAMFLSGIVAASSLGWPGISYITAGGCLAWIAVWIVLGANNATEAKLITQAERDYIETSLEHDEDFHKKKIPVPWRAIFTSVPYIALLVTRCAQSWGFATIQQQIPSYMNGVLNMNIRSNAFFSSLPYLAMWILSYVYLLAAEMIMSRQMLSLSALRKTFNTISFWIPAFMLIGIGFLDDDSKPLAITLMTLNVGINSGSTIGSLLNTIDLSPNHAGLLMGIVNTAANTVPILTPIVVGFIVIDESDRTQWQIVFAIAAVILFLGNLIFVVWGRTSTQPWDAVDYLTGNENSSMENASQRSVKSLVFENESEKQKNDWQEAKNQ